MTPAPRRLARWLWRQSPWLLVPVAIAAGLVASERLRGPARAGTNEPPAAAFPQVVDLGECDLGSISIGRFTIANRGGSDLLIDGVRANCACTGLERQTGNGFERMHALRIPPGGSEDLVIRLSVSGEIGGQTDNVVYFRTNDPAKPEGAVVVRVSRVTGGVQAVPSIVAFGTVPAGEPAEQVVDLYDASVNPRTVAAVNVSDPGRFAVELVAAEPPPTPAVAGRHVARIKVRVRTATAGPLDGLLHVQTGADGRVQSIPMTGRVRPTLELIPSTVVLPLVSEGVPVYATTCLCKNHTGRAIQLSPDAPPEGVSVSVTPAGGNDDARVRVVVDPALVPAAGVKTIGVRFRAAGAEQENPLELKLLLQGGANHEDPR